MDLQNGVGHSQNREFSYPNDIIQAQASYRTSKIENANNDGFSND